MAHPRPHDPHSGGSIRAKTCSELRIPTHTQVGRPSAWVWAAPPKKFAQVKAFSSAWVRLGMRVGMPPSRHRGYPGIPKCVPTRPDLRIPTHTQEETQPQPNPPMCPSPLFIGGHGGRGPSSEIDRARGAGVDRGGGTDEGGGTLGRERWLARRWHPRGFSSPVIAARKVLVTRLFRCSCPVVMTA